MTFCCKIRNIIMYSYTLPTYCYTIGNSILIYCCIIGNIMMWFWPIVVKLIDQYDASTAALVQFCISQFFSFKTNHFSHFTQFPSRYPEMFARHNSLLFELWQYWWQLARGLSTTHISTQQNTTSPSESLIPQPNTTIWYYFGLQY